jgi:hypothetical protein
MNARFTCRRLPRGSPLPGRAFVGIQHGDTWFRLGQGGLLETSDDVLTRPFDERSDRRNALYE